MKLIYKDKMHGLDISKIILASIMDNFLMTQNNITKKW
jgi:hypothetical protein